MWTVLNLIALDFDHSNLLSNGRLIDTVTNFVVESNVIRRVACICFRDEKYGSIALEYHCPFQNVRKLKFVHCTLDKHSLDIFLKPVQCNKYFIVYFYLIIHQILSNLNRFWRFCC